MSVLCCSMCVFCLRLTHSAPSRLWWALLWARRPAAFGLQECNYLNNADREKENTLALSVCDYVMENCVLLVLTLSAVIHDGYDSWAFELEWQFT